MASSLVPVLTALIAALSVLAGAFLNHRLAAREGKLERAIRARQEALDFRLARGEQLYLWLDHIRAYAARHASLIQLHCHGRSDMDRFRLDRADALALLDQAELARVELTVLAFFPQLAGLHAELIANLGRLRILDEVLLGSQPGKADLHLKLSKDAGRLERIVKETGDRLRDELVRDLSGLFSSRSEPA